jgi:hypothetical protein
MKTSQKMFALVLLAGLLLTACGAVNDLKAVAAQGNAFMQALKDADHAKSWAMLTPDLQKEMGGLDQWTQFAAPRNFSKWSFSSNNISNDSGQLEGEATLGSDTYSVTLVMQKVDSVWLVAGIQIDKK